MDAIDRAVRDGYAAAGMERFSTDTWEQFEAAAAGKKLFLFGAGVGARFFYHKYIDTLPLEGVIDNNAELWGRYVYERVPEAMLAGNLGMKIDGIRRLLSYSPDDVVVLIASLKNACEIADALEQAGIKNCFSLLHLEFEDRKKRGIKETSEWKRSYEQILQEYKDNLLRLPVDKKKLVFFTQSDYAGHGKEIVMRLLQERNDLEIVWLVQNESLKMPQGIRTVSQKNWLACTYEAATAGFWIVDIWLPDYVPKREEQYYIHLTHWSSVTLKSFGYRMTSSRKDTEGMKINIAGGGALDYIFVGSDFDENACRECYCFSGNTVHVGSPRSDILFRWNERYAAKIKDACRIPAGKRLLIYAPTFRSTFHREDGFKEEFSYQCPLDFAMVKHCMEKRFGGAWLILLRLHPWVAKLSGEITLPDFVIDVSAYPDSEELVAISDVMVSDYSSIMFEPALVRKPVFLLATDRARYLAQDRDFLIDYESLPFPRAVSNAELAGNIACFDEEKYIRDVDTFMEKYGVHEDGYAGERAAKFILDLMDGKRKPEKIMGPLVSVIVPIYNVAPYLARCIESIIGQTYQNLEIILVDDGSTDSSYEIAKRYAASDQRIRLFTQKNQGVTIARKRGIDAANGEWVGFVDSDDWIEPKMYERLSYFMGQFDCDMVSMGLIAHEINGSKGVWHDHYFQGFYDNLERDIYPTMVHDYSANIKGMRCYTVTKLFRRELLARAYQDVDMKIFYHEDAMLVWRYLLLCSCVYILHEPLYHYCRREDSVQNSVNLHELTNNVYLYKNLEKVFSAHKNHCILIPQLKQFAFYLMKRNFRMLYKINDEEMTYWEYPDYEKIFGKKFVIYGAGKGGQRFYKSVVQRGDRQSIVAWVDREVRGKSADKFFEIQPVETITKVDYDYIAVAILKRDIASEAIKELEERWHIPSEKIVWGVPVCHNFWTLWDNMYMQEMIHDA